MDPRPPYLTDDALDDSAGPPVMLPGQRFHFHDLRAAYVTEHKRQRNRLPDIHPDGATTARIYERSKIARRTAI